MTQLDRRRVLTTLGGGAAVAGVSYAISKDAFAASESDALHECAGHYCWYLAQQGGRPPRQRAIEFWTGPFAAIRYENYLPPQIGRTFIAYENFPEPIDSADKALEAFNEASKFYRRDWLDYEKLDRFTVEPANGLKDFQSILAPFVGEKNPSNRTALLNIDNIPGRPEVCSAFSTCYNSMIGIAHIDERGFVQQKRYYRGRSESEFVRRFLRDTSLCDIVIVTSSGLFEIDAGLSPHASTEDIVGELVRRLGYALMEPKILKRIVGPRSIKSKPRYFALGNATLNAPFEPTLHFQTMLDRQSAFVSAGFAPLAADELPLSPS